MKVRSFHTKIWSDKFFLGLTPTEKLLFIYYVFNPRVNIIYCYECPDNVTRFETGLSQDILDTSKKKFSEKKKILFNEDYIFIVNGSRYQLFSGPKNDAAKVRLFDEMNNSVKSWYDGVSDRGIDRGIHRGIDTPSIPSETETEIKYETETQKKEDVRPEDIPEEVWLKRAFEKNKL